MLRELLDICRTLAGLVEFAVVQFTARKRGIDSYDALTRLFTTGAWLSSAAAPGE